jgi:uncharacterized protein YjdB
MANFTISYYNGYLMTSSREPRMRLNCTVALFFLLLLLTACGGDSSSTGTSTVGPVSKITISPATASIPFGQKQTYFPVPVDASGNSVSGVSYTWNSSSPTVATIDGNGVATGLANGTTQITAASGGVTSNAVTLTVTQRVARVDIAPMSSSVAVGGTKQFTATAFDASGNVVANAGISWFCSFSGVATIDNTGLVKGVSPGTVTIMASAGSVNSQPAAFTVTP